jgi:alpha,alpha-trehalose phosphorylase
LDGKVSFTPRLPDGITRLAFTILLRGRRLHVEVTHEVARYQLVEGDSLDIEHHGKQLSLSAGATEEQAIPEIAAQPRPSQPAGREPARRRVAAKPA